MIRRTRPHPRPPALAARRRAAVAVELALSLSMLLVPMLLGIWEVGCLLDAQQTLVEAVREGGRQAASGQMTAAGVQQVVLLSLTNSGVSTRNVAVTVVNSGTGSDPSVAAQLDPLMVSATLPYANVSWSTTSMFVPSTVKLTASSYWYSNKDVPYTVQAVGPTQ